MTGKEKIQAPTLAYKAFAIFALIACSAFFPKQAAAEIYGSSDTTFLHPGIDGTTLVQFSVTATTTLQYIEIFAAATTGPRTNSMQLFDPGAVLTRIITWPESSSPSWQLYDFTTSTYQLYPGRVIEARADTESCCELAGSASSTATGPYDGWAIRIYTGSSTPDQANFTTRIVDFSPADNAALPAAPVTFSLHAYINPDDIGTFIGVRFSLENIDQNVLLFTSLSPASFFLLDGFTATTSGNFYYTSDPQILGEGNYMVTATIERSYLGGWVVNPFSPITETQSHQFSVGSSTFIGNIQQNAFSDLQTFFSSSTATSTEATSRDCNPLAFDTRNCLAYLLIPSRQDLQNSILGLKDQILTRVPWGYPTRFYNILTSTATASLPSFSVNLHLGAGEEDNPATSTLTFSPDDMLTGGAALASSITDRTYGLTARQITEPFVKGGLALLVLFIIVGDILGGTMSAEGGGSGGKSGLQRQAAITKKEYTF